MYKLNFQFLQEPIYQGYFLEGIKNTAIISFFCIIFGFLIGLIIALCRQSKLKPLRIFGTIWVDFLRNTPFLVQLFFVYYGLPQMGIDTDPILTTIIALSINTSVGNCEVIRAGLMAVKNGYYECATALGCNQFQTFRFIVIPISLRVAFKPLVNNFVNLVLTTSVAFSVSVMELTGAGKVTNGRVDKPFEIYLFIMLLYCVFTFFISFVSKAVDKKISIKL